MTKMTIYGNGIEGRQAAAHCNPQPSTLNISTAQQGFTLVELLIVTVVIVALMGIMFRLTGLVGGTDARQTTIKKMQRLENCLSGYYAAFGQYPPVPLQGFSHNIYCRVCSHKIQLSKEENPKNEDEAWASVEAACRAQPVAAIYPPAKSIFAGNGDKTKDADTLLKNYIDAVREMHGTASWENGNSIAYRQLYSQNNANKAKYKEGLWSGSSDFTDLQVFRFGLMSFLLPRYRFMLECARKGGLFDEVIDGCKQWTDFNPLPAHMDSGVLYQSWGYPGNTATHFVDLLGEDGKKPDADGHRWEVDLIPSQAACARWMPNLENIVSGPSNSFFGVMVTVKDSYSINDDGFTVFPSAPSPPCVLGDHTDGTCGSQIYKLLKMTVVDGWGHEFYYYCPPPYQSYILWSAGEDGRTFPPWIDKKEFRKSSYSYKETALGWAVDDIAFMAMGEK